MAIKEKIKAEFKVKKMGLSNCRRPRMYESEWWESLIPLLVFRVAAAIITVVVLILQFLYAGEGRFGNTIIYFTVWSFIMVTLYFIWASLSSVTALVYVKYYQCPQGSPLASEFTSTDSSMISSVDIRVQDDTAPSPRVRNRRQVPLPWKILHGVQWILYDITLSNAILVTLVYWAVLYPMLTSNSDYKTSFFDFLIHAFNSILMITECCLNSIPTQILHVIYPITYALVYLIFSIIIYYTTYIVLYPYVIDWSRPQFTVLSIVGILVYFLLCQFGFFLISLLKSRYRRRAPASTQPQSNERPS